MRRRTPPSESVPCDWCSAEPGQKCRTATGQFMGSPHRDRPRRYLRAEAWDEGANFAAKFDGDPYEWNPYR